MPRILIVEDNPADVFLIREALSKTDLSAYQIDVVSDGDDAIRQLQRTDDPPALVVLDLNLPRMDGNILIRAIRSNSRLDQTVVVTWTSSLKPQEGQRLQSLGIDMHIIKPLHWEEYEALGGTLSALVARGRTKTKTGDGGAGP